MLITVLIDKIYLYDDYAIIFFNTQEKEYKVEVPTIEEAEVRTNDTSAHHIKMFRKSEKSIDILIMLNYNRSCD